MDHHKLAVLHPVDLSESNSFKIRIDVSHIIFSGFLFIFAIPVFDLRIDFQRRVRQFIIVGRPKHIADRLIGVGLVKFHSGGATSSNNFRLRVRLRMEI